MVYTEMVKKACRLAYAAHHGQADKGGVPYIFHPFSVAMMMEDEATTVAALLHDVVEDTEVSLDELAGEGFPLAVIDAVALLTHKEDEDYLDYVRRIKGNPIARAVKLGDLKHNTDPGRMVTDNPGLARKKQIYYKAIEILEED